MKGGVPILGLAGHGEREDQQHQGGPCGETDEGIGGRMGQDQQAGVRVDGLGQLPGPEEIAGGPQGQGQQGIEYFLHRSNLLEKQDGRPDSGKADAPIVLQKRADVSSFSPISREIPGQAHPGAGAA